MHKIKCFNCKEILETIDKRRKFCSPSCSSIFNNHNRKGKKLNYSEESMNRLKERMANNNPATQKYVRKKISKALKGREVPWLKGKKRPEHSKFMKQYYLDHKEESCFGKGNPDIAKYAMLNSNGRSKLSKMIHKELLKYGNWEKEYRIGRYFCDDVDLRNKIIIETNGDRFHANPDLYKWNDRPHPFDQNLIAKDLWEYDNKRKKFLESKGYRVFYIWENDINIYGLKKGVRRCLAETM